jgi:glycosyltransferase involved in cell wall biosynthesis
MTSIVIAAHNEAAMIGACLDSLLDGAASGEFDITVVANGCTDDTAAVASTRPGVRVLELGVASKVAALNAGDEVAVGFPRIYLDGDIRLGAAAVRALAAATAEPGVLASMPRRVLDVAGRPLPVKAYYAINSRLPVYRDGLFGRGAICLSEAARARFVTFPEVTADDLFLDSLYTSAQKRQVDSVSSLVATPRRTKDLIRRLVRVRAGNQRMRASGAPVRGSSQWSWLRDVVLPRPWLAPAGVVYATITLIAARSARRSRGGTVVWGRDESSRAA